MYQIWGAQRGAVEGVLQRDVVGGVVERGVGAEERKGGEEKEQTDKLSEPR